MCRVSDRVKNMIEQDMPQIVTRNMRFVCWITKAQDTQ